MSIKQEFKMFTDVLPNIKPEATPEARIEPKLEVYPFSLSGLETSETSSKFPSQKQTCDKCTQTESCLSDNSPRKVKLRMIHRNLKRELNELIKNHEENHRADVSWEIDDRSNEEKEEEKTRLERLKNRREGNARRQRQRRNAASRAKKKERDQNKNN